MENKEKITKFLKIFMFLPLLFIDAKSFSIDTYFLINHGKYIINNGFPMTEVFTIHNDLNFTMQQWIPSLIFYGLYSLFGLLGTLIYVYIFYALYIFLVYKICLLINGRKITSNIMAFLSGLIFAIFAETRPQMMSCVFILLTIYILEKYRMTNNKKWLIFIPIISILQINCHATMYIYIFAAICSYLFTFNFLTGKYIVNSKRYDKKPLVFVMLISIPCMLINPYGFDNLLYIFRSMSSNLSLLSNEMKTADISNYGGQCLCLIIVVLILLILYYRNKFELCHLILFIGSIALTLMAIRNLMLVAISFPILLSSFLINFNDEEKLLNKVFGYYQIMLPIFLILAIGIRIYNFDNFKLTRFCTRFDSVNDVTKCTEYLIDNTDYKNIKCYASQQAGAYLEFYGIHPYIDDRSEIFLEPINEKKDIINEYLMLQLGRLDIKEFIDEYKFDYFIVSSNDILYEYLEKNKYEMTFEDQKEDLRIYKAH